MSSRAETETINCLSGFVETDDGEAHAFFTFGEDFIGFQGHFPEEKILPGICQLQCVIATVGRWKGKRVKLKKVVKAKYQSPVLPGERIKCVCRNLIEKDRAFQVDAVITREEATVAQFRLIVDLSADFGDMDR